jgi:glycosidase
VLLLAPGACDPSGAVEADPPPPPDAWVFSYTPPRGAPAVTAVAVAGSFNDWSTTATPMVRQSDGSWQVRLTPQAAGPHEYKFHINGTWPSDMCRDTRWGDPARDYWIDARAMGCVPDGLGGQNAVANVGLLGDTVSLGLHHDPQSPAHLSVADGRLSVRFRATRQVQSATLYAGDLVVPMHRQLAYRLHDVWRGTLPKGTPSYRIVAQAAGSTQSLGPFTAPGALFESVPWVGASVGYQIFPERFQNGNAGNDEQAITTDEYAYLHPTQRGTPPTRSAWSDPPNAQHCCHQYFGGDLQGVVDRLDHLQSLGVTLLYLNPIFRAGSAHGYDTWDYLQVDSALGDEQVLRTLIDQARARGMRVMWDFVPNHVGVGNPAFQDAIQKGPASEFWSWFTFKVPFEQVQAGNGNHYNGWWGFGGLPELNTRNAAVRAHLMGAVRKWTEFGFDGIRVDVPGDIDNRAEFFREFRQVAKAIDPDVYLVGEIWQRSPSWLQGDEFDALMNYAIGQDVIERFARGEMTAAVASGLMAQLYAEYPEASAAMQFNVISTHDNARVLTKLGGGRLGATPGPEALARQRLASAMLYAVPGVPVTFQGDECAFLGLGGGDNREENRYPLQWASCDQAMLAHYRALARLKRENPALASPAIRFHGADGSLLSWFRGEPGPGEVLAIFNGGSTSRSLALPAGAWTDAVTGQAVTGSADVAALGWRWLRRA